MLNHTDLKKGLEIILDGNPYEVLSAAPLKKAQGQAVIKTKIKNLTTGAVLERNFHQGETFEEADLSKIEAKFLYSRRGRYFFCDVNDLSKRFDFAKDQIDDKADFLKPNQMVEAIVFQGKIINIKLPIKVHLRVVEAPPGVKGDRAQGGTKIVKLETDATINAPLFIKKGDLLEINVETGEYVRRVE